MCRFLTIEVILAAAGCHLQLALWILEFINIPSGTLIRTWLFVMDNQDVVFETSPRCIPWFHFLHVKI